MCVRVRVCVRVCVRVHVCVVRVPVCVYVCVSNLNSNVTPEHCVLSLGPETPNYFSIPTFFLYFIVSVCLFLSYFLSFFPLFVSPGPLSRPLLLSLSLFLIGS